MIQGFNYNIENVTKEQYQILLSSFPYKDQILFIEGSKIKGLFNLPENFVIVVYFGYFFLIIGFILTFKCKNVKGDDFKEKLTGSFQGIQNNERHDKLEVENFIENTGYVTGNKDSKISVDELNDSKFKEKGERPAELQKPESKPISTEPTPTKEQISEVWDKGGDKVVAIIDLLPEKYLTPDNDIVQSVVNAYNDGSNPELVKAVDEMLNPVEKVKEPESKPTTTDWNKKIDESTIENIDDLQKEIDDSGELTVDLAVKIFNKAIELESQQTETDN